MKTILITGGSRGIGAALVRKFAREGWKVAFFYKYSAKDKVEKLASETGAIEWNVDISCDANMEEAMEYVADKFDGKIDCLINNAGISINKMLVDMTYSEIKRINDINILGTENTTRLALRHLPLESGVVVNISSIQGVTGAACESVYAASKAAITNFTQSMNDEYSDCGIKFFSAQLGWVDTDMTKEYSAEDLDSWLSANPSAKHQTPPQVADDIYKLVDERICELKHSK